MQFLTQMVSGSPRRRVQAGLWTFFTGSSGLLLGVLAQLAPGAGRPPLLAERFPDWPTWWIPEGPAGYTAAALLVCWGVWSLGAGLRLARGDDDAAR